MKKGGNEPDGAVRLSALKSVIKTPSPEVVGNDELVCRLSALHDIACKIDRAAGRQEIVAILRSSARQVVSHEACLMALLNRAGTHYVINTLSPVADSADLDHKHFIIDEGMPGWVMKNELPTIGEIGSGPAFSHALEGKLRDLGIRSLLIVPMKAGGGMVGALLFGSVNESRFTEADASVGQMLGHCVSTALRHTSLFEDARKRIGQIELINEVSARLASVLHFDELLRAAASTIQKSFNYFDVTVFLLSGEKSELVLEAHAGNFVDFLPHGYRQNVEQGIIGWVVRHGERVLANDVTQDPRYLAYAYHNTKSELALPIRIDGAVVGVLNVEDAQLHAFDDTDAVVLETLCDQLGIAIKNAKLYDEIQQANQKLTELDRMKSEFLGIVSHDFRSPLSSIILAGKALLKNETVKGIQRVKEYLQIIVEQANRLNQLAEDTLSITKMESGQLSYYFKIVNIERMIQDAASMVRFSSRHSFEYHVHPSVAFIKGDQTKLRQVVQNLISNAVKYSPHGGKVVVTVEEAGSEKIRISVSDEGIGIPADQVGRLFRKFARVDSGEAREIKGAGLGLWICREVVTAHGGEIWIESELGKGSTVRFTLTKAH